MMRVYTITSRDEETYCRYCGQPLGIGDKVTESIDQSEVYCSARCSDSHDLFVAMGLQKRRMAHHRALETLAQQVNCDANGLTLWRQLRRLENWLDYRSTQHCNGDIDGEQWETIKEQGLAKLSKIFGNRLPDGVFINSDPRGYALKLDNERVTIPAGMHTDWGGYGILAAEID